MAALRTLITGELAPVGQPVLWRESRHDVPAFDGYRTHWVNSGTAALALALWVARARRPDVTAPEVLLPAYGCPDLIAAAEYAGVAPVLVDTGRDDPAMSNRALAQRWGSNVVAIVAVDFLGIRERIDALRAQADEHDAFLIEDAAQWYPEQPTVADAVVLSFGRGKPVNLLGGGGLLLRADHRLPRELELAPYVDDTLPLGFKAAMFNVALRRHAYSIVTRLPGLSLGETRFKPLTSVAAMEDARRRLLAANVEHWLGRNRWREHRLDQALADQPGMTALPVLLAPRSGRLLRYPVLMATREMRDRAVDTLRVRGLGGSALYQAPLSQVAGVPDAVRRQAAGHDTESFADRLVTLPLHDGVRASDLARMVRILKRSRGKKSALRPATDAI
jgi:dTDP-4-amino-4,6-dideoxygalactose transaminase